MDSKSVIDIKEPSVDNPTPAIAKLKSSTTGRIRILPKEIPLTTEQISTPTSKNMLLAKSVMDDVEDEAKNNGVAPKVTPNLALARALRRNIEAATKRLERTASVFTAIDWLLFILAAVFMLLISMDIQHNITSSFTLDQLLSALALAVKSLEKTLNLSNLAKNKIAQAKELKTLTQQISNMEFSLYLQPESNDASIRDKNAAAMQAIWAQYNSIDLKTFLPPPRSDLANANTTNTNSNTTNNGTNNS